MEVGGLGIFLLLKQSGAYTGHTLVHLTQQVNLISLVVGCSV